MQSSTPVSFPIVAVALVLAALQVPAPAPAQVLEFPELEKQVQIFVDPDGMPHIFARNDHDAAFALGWMQARDRLFQIDMLRRLFSGRLAEMLGEDALESDIMLRTLGLRRAAERSLAVQTGVSLERLRGYSRGVNAFLEDRSSALPPEYAALELTRERIPPWSPTDSLTLLAGLAFVLTTDLSDIENTVALQAFLAAGDSAGFDGAALFFEDVFRFAPFDPTRTVPPEASPATSTLARPVANRLRLKAPRGLLEQAAALGRQVRQRMKGIPLLEKSFERSEAQVGSNWLIVAGELSESGQPLIASDNHLDLVTPSQLYEFHLRIVGGPRRPTAAIGTGFPGTPALLSGCNLWICSGVTSNPVDVTDVYLERLVLDPETGAPVQSLFRGEREPLTLIPQTFRANLLDGTADNLTEAPVPPEAGGLTVVVPRHGPLVAVDASDPEAVTGLSVQWTGSEPIRILDGLIGLERARGLEQAEAAVGSFHVGANFGVIAHDGIGYFMGGEIPLRDDLQNLMAPDGGIPPFLIRDGSGTLRHEWLASSDPPPGQTVPFEVLPRDEVPRSVDPSRGFLVNSNNDPLGTSVDNNPLNQLRPEGGLLYLGTSFASGFRVGQSSRLLESELEADGTISLEELGRIQASDRLLDAEVLLPHVLAAFETAQACGDARLAALGADPRLAAAIDRLSAWDFTTPTGIPEGYDSGDDPADLPVPSVQEMDASVAATIYAVWRGQLIGRVIDGTLASVGLEEFTPGSVLGDFGPGGSIAMRSLRHHLAVFDERQGFGASGVFFFEPEPGTETSCAASRGPEVCRDIVLLDSLRSALDLLAGESFATAFDRSGELSEYRWGKLHRVVLEHPFGGPFSIPPAGGFSDLGGGLPGISRSGGYAVLDAGPHDARADAADEFTFSIGPGMRFLATLFTDGPEMEGIIAGGQSGILGSPHYADQVNEWLVNRFNPWRWRPGEVASHHTERLILKP